MGQGQKDSRISLREKRRMDGRSMQMRIEGKSGRELKDATGIHGVNSRDMFVEGMGNSSVWLPRV